LKNTITWNSIVFGLVNHGYCKETIELFNQMEKEGVAKLDHLASRAALTDIQSCWRHWTWTEAIQDYAWKIWFWATDGALCVHGGSSWL